MLEHVVENIGEGLMLLVGFWRFVFSPTYRARKLEEWRATRHTVGGQASIAMEILAAIVIGVLLPIWLIALVAVNV